MNTEFDTISERAVILAPQGRDALVAASILREGGVTAEICSDLHNFSEKIADGSGVAVLSMTLSEIQISEFLRSGSNLNLLGRIFPSFF